MRGETNLYDGDEAAPSASGSILSGLKKKNVLSTAGSKTKAPPINKFAHNTNISSPSKKRSFAQEDLKTLMNSPSPKKPALNVSDALTLEVLF